MFTDCGFLMVGARLVHSYIANVWRFGVWFGCLPLGDGRSCWFVNCGFGLFYVDWLAGVWLLARFRWQGLCGVGLVFSLLAELFGFCMFGGVCCGCSLFDVCCGLWVVLGWYL